MYNKNSLLQISAILPLMLLLCAGCQKYAPLQPVPQTAYFRLFNNIVNTSTDTSAATSHILTMLIDPVPDKDNKPQDASVIGDFLCLKAYYASPQETHPDINNARYLNLEYPGSYPVRVGGVINGLDLSRWAQVSSGRHRILMLRHRMSGNNVYFVNYTSSIQRDADFSTALDTTVDLSAGAIYTAEIRQNNPADAGQLSFYMRQEPYDKGDLSDTSKIYVNFYNYLTAPGSPDSLDVYAQVRYYTNCIGPLQIIHESTPLSYSFGTSQEGSWAHVTNALSKEQFLTGLGRSSLPAHPFVAVPMPPIDSFYYREGPALLQYRLPFDRPRFLYKFYPPGHNSSNSAPLFTLSANEFNSPALLNTSSDTNVGYVNYTYEGDLTAACMTSPYQTVISGGVSRVLPMVNTIELMNYYNGTNSPTSSIKPFQISVQRPFDPAFVR